MEWGVCEPRHGVDSGPGCFLAPLHPVTLMATSSCVQGSDVALGVSLAPWASFLPGPGSSAVSGAASCLRCPGDSLLESRIQGLSYSTGNLISPMMPGLRSRGMNGHLWGPPLVCSRARTSTCIS